MSSTAPVPAVWSRSRHITRRGVLWLGLRCDVRCKFCYDELVGSREKMWIPLHEATRTLDKFRFFYANEFVDFMGGEPTLHPDVLNIVAHAARIGLRPTVITHGMHLADLDRARAYQQAGIHDFLISIHGIGDTVASIHRRGKKNFTRQVTALDNLRALGIPFRFNVTMIRDNLTELTTIADLAGEKGELPDIQPLLRVDRPAGDRVPGWALGDRPVSGQGDRPLHRAGSGGQRAVHAAVPASRP